jgi:predicted dehydrogenase
MKKWRGAVCGVGYLGRFHAQKIKSHPSCELVGVYDARGEQADAVATELGVRGFSSLDQVANSVDFVIVAAATQAHYELAEFFLLKKIPTLVEKPIAATAELGFKLVKLAAHQNVLFTVGHSERFNPSFDFIRENKNKLKYLELNRCAPFKSRGSDVSVMHDLTVHDLDFVDELFNIFDSQSATVMVESKIFGLKMITSTLDEISLRLSLKNGTQITINNSRTTPIVKRSVRAVFLDRTLFINTATQEGEILTADPTSADKIKIEKFVVDKVDALAAELNHFVEALGGQHPVKVNPENAARQLKKIEEFIQSV